MFTRDHLTHGAFRLNLLGTTHNIVYTPSLVRAVLMRRSSEIDQHSAVWYILKNVFGTSEKYKGAYIEGYDELNGPVIACLLQQPWLGQMMQTVAHNLE